MGDFWLLVAAPPIAGLGGIAGTQGLTTQTLYDANLTDNVGLETAGGISVTNPLGGTYTVSLNAAIAKLGQPIAQGGAGITFAAGTPGSAVVNLNAENEVSFSISDAQGRSLMSGILHPHDAVAPNTAGTLLTWSCNVPDTTETIDGKVYPGIGVHRTFSTEMAKDTTARATLGIMNVIPYLAVGIDKRSYGALSTSEIITERAKTY